MDSPPSTRTTFLSPGCSLVIGKLHRFTDLIDIRSYRVHISSLHSRCGDDRQSSDCLKKAMFFPPHDLVEDHLEVVAAVKQCRDSYFS